MSVASLLGALTWKEQFDDDEEQTRARVLAKKMRARRHAAERRAKQKTKPAKVVNHRDGTRTVQVKLSVPHTFGRALGKTILLSRSSAIKQSNYRQTSGIQQCTGCRFNKDGYCQQHDFYLQNSGTKQTCNEWQRRR
jgi:hypothetical protein